jgi:hypothetical protein
MEKLIDLKQPTPRVLGWPILGYLHECGQQLVYDGRQWGCDRCGVVVDMRGDK